MEIPELGIRDSMKTTVFWKLFFCFLLWSLGLFLVLVHLVPYLTDIRVSLQHATNVLSLIGLSSILGKVFLGNLSDRIKPKLILIASLSVQAAMISWILFLRNPIGFYIFRDFIRILLRWRDSDVSYLDVEVLWIKCFGYSIWYTHVRVTVRRIHWPDSGRIPFWSIWKLLSTIYFGVCFRCYINIIIDNN